MAGLILRYRHSPGRIPGAYFRTYPRIGGYTFMWIAAGLPTNHGKKSLFLLSQPRLPVDNNDYRHVQRLIHLYRNQEAAILGDVKPGIHSPGKTYLEQRL